jgi:DNA (cytosine-5)-methyltransferase 1
VSLVVDMFAGGGGASLGLELAGLSVDIAVNHDAEAIAMHTANHPATVHYVKDVWEVKPRAACAGRPVRLLWASPNCTHFSRARGGKPRDLGNRALSWSIVRWARDVRPDLIICENVREWVEWGPLDADGQPIDARAGESFRRWVRELERLGYVVEHRTLRACDFGAPTTRERVYLVARCDGERIEWPVSTHGPAGDLFGLQPYARAADCIDWSLPVPSIFDRAKPLVDKTLTRIARGIRKFVLCDDPYVVGDKAPSLVHLGNGERAGQAPRIYDIRAPLSTVVAGGVKHGLVVAFLARHFGGQGTAGSDLREPLRTVTAQDHHAVVTARLDGEPDRGEQVAAFLTTYYSTAIGSDVRDPLPTVTTRDRFALVMVKGTAYRIRDIGMRHLTPRELARAQGFPDSYVLDPTIDGARLSRSAQVRMIGNSVVPLMAKAIARVNLGGAEQRRAA